MLIFECLQSNAALNSITEFAPPFTAAQKGFSLLDPSRCCQNKSSLAADIDRVLELEHSHKCLQNPPYSSRLNCVVSTSVSVKWMGKLASGYLEKVERLQSLTPNSHTSKQKSNWKVETCVNDVTEKSLFVGWRESLLAKNSRET